ncbi:MAG: glycosyltransferase, partial [Actinobacteria bacterium]|nr:glycosyltransferase [Actinomycetota bacterium]
LAWRPHAGRVPALVAAACGAGEGCMVDARLVPGHLVPAVAAGAAAVLVAGVYARMSRWLHPVGAAVWSSWLLLGAAVLSWGGLFLAQLHVSRMTLALLWSTSALSAVTLPSAAVQTREGWDLLLRRRKCRAGRPPIPRGARAPKVSVHVPCHAEPPRIVIGTLERLARLDYPDFEVLVIDNNTTDPALWQPVAAHCERLGGRFRFFHVEGITGAKAGALNWALARTCPRAELIAVVDADYQVRPQWLRVTAGYFADPGVGFVQCPHAYRGYAGSALGRWANWEYVVFFATGMVSLDEARSGITVGTMSLIRRAALEHAGGWATWCLTEDSELAIRIHALGYQSVYLAEPYGWGLIPETFDGYRRQRYRWTYGPVQEFQRHWRLFLPWPLARPSALTGQQKLHHANHGLDVMCIGVRALCFPLAAAAAVSMIVHHERVQMPAELWIAATCLLAGSLVMRGLTYQRVVRATSRQAFGGILAFAALTHVITTASLRALARHPARWQRTDKFRQRQRGLRVLTQARSETVLGLAGLVAAAALIAAHSGGIATALAIGLAVQALTYLAAPTVAIAADRSLARTATALPSTGTRTAIGTARPAGANPAWAQHPSRRAAQWPPPSHDQRRAAPRATAPGSSQPKGTPPAARAPRAGAHWHPQPCLPASLAQTMRRRTGDPEDALPGTPGGLTDSGSLLLPGPVGGAAGG